MEKIIFEDLPSTKTPLSAENLNKIQENVETAINTSKSEILKKISSNYSLEEKEIGTWLGKKLYRKILVVENINVANSLDINDIDNIYLDEGHSYITWSNDLSYPASLGKFSISKTDGTILGRNEDLVEWSGVLTVEYTKTTD